MLKSVRDDQYIDSEGILLADFSREWMEAGKETLKPKTWASYDSMLRLRILPTFKDWDLRDINCAAVANWFEKIQRDRLLARKTVRNTVTFLHAIFEAAMVKDLVAANPCRKIKFPKDDGEDCERVVPTPAEVSRTFSKLPRAYHALLVIGAVTGFRRAELLGLRWDDVDWLGGALHVRRTLQRVKKSMLDAHAFRNVERIGNTGLALVTPKSKKSRRRVEIHKDLVAVLRAERERSTGPFIFESESGGPIDPDAVNDVLEAAEVAAGVRQFRFHGLRHLYSSLLVESGANPKFAQEKMGHASATTTLDIYSHVITDQGRQCADKVAAAFPCVSNLLADASVAGLEAEPVN